MVNGGNVGGRVPLVLLLLRLSVFLVMLMWNLDKFFNTEHARQVFQAFYGLGGLGNAIIYSLAIVQLILILGFVAGVQKPITYGAVLIMHGASTLVSLPRYFAPFESANLLFFAAWPMLAACFALFYLRDFDNIWVVEKQQPGKSINP